MAELERIDLHANGLRFSALAQGQGPVVLCLHGFPDCMHSYRFQLPALADAGYRAISPTLRGYEPSSQPADGDYAIVRMAEDTLGWIDELGGEKVHLIGHDWGAVIAYAVTALAPQRFHSVTTMAIPHPGRMRSDGIPKLPGQIRNSWYMFFFQIRGLADRVVERNDWAFIERLWRDWSPGWELPTDALAEVKHTLAQPGVKKAALGYYRAMFNPFHAGTRETTRLLSEKMNAPTLALTGALDGCMDSRMHDYAMKDEDFPAGFEMHRVQGAGHFLHQEKPEEVNALLLDWLRRHTPES